MLITKSTAGGLLCSLSDAKAHLRVNITADDSYISSLCNVASRWVEAETGIRFFADVYDEYFPKFELGTGAAMQLTRYPVASVASIQYFDMSNTLQTWGSQFYDLSLPTNGKARFSPVFGTFYPVTRPRPDAVCVEYTTGYPTPPALAVHAAKLIIGSMYINRESESPTISRSLQFGLDRIFAQLSCRGYY